MTDEKKKVSRVADAREAEALARRWHRESRTTKSFPEYLVQLKDRYASFSGDDVSDVTKLVNGVLAMGGVSCI